MSSGQLARPLETTAVEVSAKANDGALVSQIYPIQHPQGMEPSQIIASASQIFLRMGGLMVDTLNGGMQFYPTHLFVGPVSFEIKSIVLAAGSSLPAQRLLQ